MFVETMFTSLKQTNCVNKCHVITIILMMESIVPLLTMLQQLDHFFRRMKFQIRQLQRRCQLSKYKNVELLRLIYTTYFLRSSLENALSKVHGDYFLVTNFVKMHIYSI